MRGESLQVWYLQLEQIGNPSKRYNAQAKSFTISESKTLTFPGFPQVIPTLYVMNDAG